MIDIPLFEKVLKLFEQYNVLFINFLNIDLNQCFHKAKCCSPDKR